MGVLIALLVTSCIFPLGCYFYSRNDPQHDAVVRLIEWVVSTLLILFFATLAYTGVAVHITKYGDMETSYFMNGCFHSVPVSDVYGKY